jgi:hypothetical protein
VTDSGSFLITPAHSSARRRQGPLVPHQTVTRTYTRRGLGLKILVSAVQSRPCPPLFSASCPSPIFLRREFVTRFVTNSGTLQITWDHLELGKPFSLYPSRGVFRRQLASRSEKVPGRLLRPMRMAVALETICLGKCCATSQPISAREPNNPHRQIAVFKGREASRGTPLEIRICGRNSQPLRYYADQPIQWPNSSSA